MERTPASACKPLTTHMHGLLDPIRCIAGIVHRLGGETGDPAAHAIYVSDPTSPAGWAGGLPFHFASNVQRHTRGRGFFQLGIFIGIAEG